MNVTQKEINKLKAFKSYTDDIGKIIKLFVEYVEKNPLQKEIKYEWVYDKYHIQFIFREVESQTILFAYKLF